MIAIQKTEEHMETCGGQILFPTDYKNENQNTNNSYQQKTCDIVSKVAYLSGVRESIFENPHTSVDCRIFKAMSQEKDARIVRALNMLRTVVNCNFLTIEYAMTHDMKNLHTIDLTKEIVQALRKDDVDIIKPNTHAAYYITAINQQMLKYIDRCKRFFPEWIEYKYIRNLFLFPGCDTKAKYYFAQYMENINRLPYQVCINWKFRDQQDPGNIFQSDQKFLSLLYQQFGDTFTHYNSVHMESRATRSALDLFAVRAKKIVLIVGCENSDPIKVCAALQSMNDEMRCKLVKVILYNDVHTSSCWDLIARFTNISVEQCMIQRVLEHKSLVDATLIAGVCREHYQNSVDSFLLASSDSDFISLVRNLPDAGFLWLVENSKISEATLEELKRKKILFCSLDEFNTGGAAYILKKNALLEKCNEFIPRYFTSFSIDDMMRFAFENTYIQMSEKEKQIFRKKYLQGLHVDIDAKGNLSLVLGG